MRIIFGFVAVLLFLSPAAFAAIVEDWSKVNQGKDAGTYADTIGSKVEFVVEAGLASGEVTLAVSPTRKYRVVPLDESGKEGAPLKAVLTKGVLQFSLSPADHTAYYRVTASSN